MITIVILLASLLSFVAPQNPPSGSASQRMDTSRWNDYEAPFRLAGPIYYVGTTELAAFLVSTPQGHILIDGGMPSTAPVIEKSIRELGFKPEDIRILLTTQAHFDHVGSHAHFKKLSGARAEAMRGDETLLRDGGKSDYLFGTRADYHFPRVPVDRVLKDGDLVSLGGVRITARHTPGHTPGSTTYLMTVPDNGRDYQVVFAASTTVNPGTRLVTNPSYPGILEDFRKTFSVLESLKPDIFLSGHTSFFDLRRKRAAMTKDKPAEAFVDPDGYRKLIAERKKEFEALAGGK
ncbi:MAG: subclass B3 metallo-beta-lactamase [Acidobacteria bacterium]|nr:subclass B3 metallo-beta-lactamase [Acidobacteriota bacterium]